jgi:hypothetical protein
VTATLAAALWVWRTGALLLWLAGAVAIVEVVVHVIRPPRHKPHHHDPAS